MHLQPSMKDNSYPSARQEPFFGPLGGIPGENPVIPPLYALRIVLFLLGMGTMFFFAESYLDQSEFYMELKGEDSRLPSLLAYLFIGCSATIVLAAWTTLCILFPLSPHPLKHRMLAFCAAITAIWAAIGVMFLDTPLPKSSWLDLDSIIQTVLLVFVFLAYTVAKTRIAKNFLA